MRKPLQVLFAIGSLAGGGSERQLVSILQHLDRSRIRPTLYLLKRSGEFLDDVPDDIPVLAQDDEPRRTPRLYFPGRMYRQQVRHLTATLRQGAFDLIYDRTILMACVAGPAAHAAGIPRVTTVVADPDQDIPATFPRFRRIRQRILTTGYRQAACVVVNSEGLQDAVQARFQLDPSQVVTIPNGFDFDAIIRRAGGEPPIDLSPDRLHVTAMGRFQPQKGFEDLLRAIRLLVTEKNRRQLMLWLMGAGPEMSRYRELTAAQPSIAEHVRMPGFMDDPFPVLRRSRMFCLSSRYEGSPNALVEAMACGTPVVATDCPYGPAEILQGGLWGELVPPGDWRQLAAAMERVLDNPEAARDRAVQAREHLRDRYDIRQTTAALTTLIEAAAHAGT